MGNINSDLHSPGEANLLLLLVRYWSNLLDTADNMSTVSKSRKLLRTPSLSSVNTQDSKLSRKLKRGRPVTLRRTEVIEEDFDWQSKTKDELQALKGSVPWKDIETFGLGNVKSPKMKRRFRKRRKKSNSVSNEMWTLSERSYKGDDESTSGTPSEKMFWRTSKLSMPDSSTRSHMLWRAFKDIELQSQNGSGIFREENEREESNIKIGNIGTMGRKARLSCWNFLRQPGKSPVRHPHVPFGRETSFRRRKPTIRRTVATGLVGRTSVRGSRRGCRYLSVPGKGWVLFKNQRTKNEGRSRDIEEEPEEEDEDCSCCSCERCNFRKRLGNMAPNSEDSLTGGWRNEMASKEPQRPPVYNPEDYALSLKKWGKKENSGLHMPLNVTQSTASLDSVSSVGSKTPKIPLSTKSSVSSGGKGKENVGGRVPVMLQPPSTGEMSLRQFSSVTELLGKLKVDLQLAFPSFVQEFVGDPVDGVTLLLELLRAVQLSQAQQQQRCPPQLQRRALLDEHSCLICLQHCLRCTDASRRLAASPAGLFTLAVCIMSNVTKSRVLALELLTNACEPPANGHGAVSDALSTLRLRFGEPVRFRFLVGMLNSAGAVELLTAGMKFINAFLETSPNVQQRVYIQAELEQAGFSAETLRKTLPSHSEAVKTEINRFERNFIDVAILQKQSQEVTTLRDKVQLFEKRIQILQEEKGVLRSLEQCLKERCCELEEEVSTKTSTTLLTARIKPYSGDKGESTPAEDEGISSSEQELSQDEEPRRLQEPIKPPRRSLMPLEEPIKPPRNINVESSLDKPKMKEPEEETTIEEVIEELQNIAKEVDTKTYLKQETKSKFEDRTRTYTKKVDKTDVNEIEIVPAMILPQPPRRAKSLVHIFLPGRECEDGKNEFFDEETDSESSDSLLTREPRRKDCPFRQSLRSTGSYNGLDSPTLATQQKVEKWREESLERRMAERPKQHRRAPYQERNIDEETIKRKNVVPPPPPFIEKVSESIQAPKQNIRNQSPFVRRTQRFVPIPVKRSQTFHTQETRTSEVKPKPKMGVSGLDIKREHGKYQNIESRNRYNKKIKDKNDVQRRGSLDELQFAVEFEESANKSRSISLERVDVGLDSFVDIVVDEVKKPKDVRNIGPRTRRSLAESSLFTPPQPKQRTSVARQHSSSSTPLTLPVEILPPATRAPPDGSSSPLDYESSSRKTSKSDESPIYATPNKPSKLQKFFGNPKFENSAGEANQKYFESNYACLERGQPPPRNVVKALLQPHPQKPVPNFYLGTYQSRLVPPAPPANPPPSLSSFGPPFLIKRNTANAGMYTGSRENLCSPTPTETSNGSGRMSASSKTTARLSDSLSGLY